MSRFSKLLTVALTCALSSAVSVSLSAQELEPSISDSVGKTGEKSIQSNTLHQKKALLNTIALPNAFRPEGIVSGAGPLAYVGSLESGSIYQIDFLTGEGKLLVDRDDGVAVGLAYDDRTNYIYAAGGTSGRLNVYDAGDGELKATYQLATDNPFINDGIITRNAAYFTNSRAKEFYRIPLAKDGSLPASQDIETISLGDEFEFVEGSVNSNGIETTADGSSLLIVNSTTGKLYEVNPENGDATEIIIANGDLLAGDGLLRRGNRVYVVQNRFNKVAEVRLGRKAAYGDIVRVIESDLFRVPTTIDSFRDDLYAVNARFGTSVNEETDYDVVRISLKRLINR